MRLNKVLLIIFICFGTVSSISYQLDYSNEPVYGQSGDAVNLQLVVANKGSGGILVYYVSNSAPSEPILLGDCIKPGSTSGLSIPFSLRKGAHTEGFTLAFFDFWGLIEGDKCDGIQPRDYDTAVAKKYSTKSEYIEITTFSGCDYGYPVCGSDYNCENNECVLKPGCRYNNPPCDEDYDCINNACVLKPGCKYNNPSCNEGFICEDNQCIAIITNSDKTRITQKINNLDESLSVMEGDVNELLPIYQELEDVNKTQYWNSVISFITQTRQKLNSVKNNIMVGERKAEVYDYVTQNINQIEIDRARIIGENPQTMVRRDIVTEQPPPEQITGDSSSSETSGDSGQSSVTVYQPDADVITTSRVYNVAIKINGINEIGDGAKFGIFVGENEFTVFKSSGRIQVKNGADWDTDFDIIVPMQESFRKLESSSDVCSTIKSLKQTGEIRGELYISDIELGLKGYRAMEDCLR